MASSEEVEEASAEYECQMFNDSAIKENRKYSSPP